MKNQILSLIILLAIPFQIFSQGNIIAKEVGVLPLPEVFSSYSSESFIKSINQDKKIIADYLKSSDERAWVVFSDRDDNKTFYEPYSNSQKGIINFMEEYYVSEVDGSWLHLVTLKTKGISGHKIDKEIGWVHAKHLILSRFPVLNKKGAPMKSMILITASDLPKNFDLNKNKGLFDDKRYYKNPTRLNGSFIEEYKGKKANKMKILFVVKRETKSSAVLLASSDKIENTSAVYGWYEFRGTTSWDTRVCLEPISGKKIDRYFKKDANGNYPSNYVFARLGDFERYKSNSQEINKESVLREIQIKKSRMPGMQMRYPIMPWEANGPVENKIAVIAQLGQLEEIKDPNNTKDCNTWECIKAKKSQELDSIKTLQNNVNVLIVLDATASMRPYGPAVAKAITQIINERQLTGKQDIKWGLAVYRDYADGEQLFQMIQPLTDEVKNVTTQLKKGKIVYDSKDAGHSESHYYGMIQAIKNAGFKNGESNIVILVGDAGNHQKDRDNLTASSVVKLLSEKNINLISFQTNFLTGSSNGLIYSKFNRDSKYYIKETAKNFIKKLKYGEGLSASIKRYPAKNSYSYELNFLGFESEKTKPSFGFFNHAIEGENMKVNQFKTMLVENFLIYMKRLDKKSKDLDDFIENQGFEKDEGETQNEFDTETRDLCKLYGFSDDLCKALVNEGDISISGYTLMTVDGEDAFTQVAYMSETIKEKLDERLSALKLVSINSGADTRTQFYETLVSLLLGLIGDQMSGNFEEELREYTFDKVWDILLNVPFSTDHPFRNKPIKDLLNSNISDVEFEIFLTNFQSQAEAFIEFPRERDLRNSVYKSGSQKFYWIPFNRIPTGADE